MRRFTYFLNLGKKLNLGMERLKEIECPCCGMTMVGEYDICPICDWENDPLQLEDPDFSGGANEMSLNEAKAAMQQVRDGKKWS